MKRIPVLTLTIALFTTGIGTAAEPGVKKGGPPQLKPLKFRLIGPAVGGRASCAAGVPGDPLTYYAATASGGVWKSIDGGIQWKPIFDDQPIASIGSLAIAPSDPNVIYVGSGEANIRGNVAPGNGIYKSTDAGKTWKHVWKQEGQIGTMIVHPANPDVAYAAVLGHAFGPNPERGVYRTTDGGKTWAKVLYKDPQTGASDVCLDPSNPRILFAGLWQTRRRPWEMTSGGPGSSLWMSRDGGDSWKQLIPRDPSDESPEKEDIPGKGLPEGTWGKIGVAVAPSDGRRVYALIEAEKGGLYRSDDGGDTWQLASGDRSIRQRAWYYSTLTIDPKNPDVVWCPQVPMLRSIDGGKTFKRVKGLHHGDNHDLWIDPRNPRRMIGSNDGGVDITTDGGESWYSPPLPIAQFYHVAADNDTPYHVSGAMQDLGTARGPSNSLSLGGITNSDWHDVGGGEAGHTAHDRTDPNIVYAGEYGGAITRYDHRTRQVRNITVYPFNPSGHGAEDLRYRFQWTAPIVISPHDSKVIYHGANVLFKTTDGGMHWQAISGDLTRNDKSKQKWSGGPITGDNTGVEVYGTIFAVAESPLQKDLLWAGTDDGRVHVSRTGREPWTDVTGNIPSMPEWGTVDLIEASPHDAGTAYVVVDAHRLDDMRPYLFKTTDYGKSWKNLAAKLPQDIYLHAVREDPKQRGLLFVGTEQGVAYSNDDGNTWTQFKLNLPTVAVHDLIVKNDDLVVGTHGRSIWIFDDLTPVRALSPAILAESAHLFAAQPAFRWHYDRPFTGKFAGENPPVGALVSYYLKDKPKGIVSLDILDAQGKLVHTIKSKPKKKDDKKEDKKEAEKEDKKPEPQRKQIEEQPALAVKPVEEPQAGSESEDEEESEGDYDADFFAPKKPVLPTEQGVNRFAWDLHYKGADKIKGAKVDAGLPEFGPMVNPGTYTLKLKADGKVLTTTVQVLPDPRAPISTSDLHDQLKLALTIRDDISRLTRMVNQLRSIKKQIIARNELLKGNPKGKSLIKPGQELLKKLDALEEKLHNPKAKVTYDILAQQGGARLYSQLALLYEAVKDGDGAPTQGMFEMYSEHTRTLNQYGNELDLLLTGDVAKLNETAKNLAIPNIIVTESSEKTSKKP